MKFRHRSTQEDKAQLSMTSMIDIVFLLLVFFLILPPQAVAGGLHSAIPPLCASAVFLCSFSLHLEDTPTCFCAKCCSMERFMCRDYHSPILLSV